MQTVMMPAAGCGTVSNAARHLQAAQPSHSDDFSHAPERIRLGTSSYSVPRFDDDLMAFR
ncbi:hypothetical protein ACVSNC_13960 [Pseudomonas aeruginosa]|uniref:hypothetical protein n=2 Tax=Gammaproteobacteria TaxID=1236 RepID=UPI0012DACA54|nr:hypothetical protein [Pseudomonas aeruginosa]MUI71861.1 hypothetical protein [Pseudomonas aeruginosa]